ncbi:hypothetical protein TNCV_1491831 [Trichonephila clavipes]|nr:hypothetical protein TNCV_1491831 [Trichonephila clavipes]
MLGGAQSEENSLAQSSQDLRLTQENVDETEVSSGILPEKAQEHIEDSQRNITSCRNEVGTLGTKDEEVTAEMDKGSMVADSFRSNRSVVPSGACKEPLPAPGNRSNERRYKEEDLATTGGEEVGTGEKERVARKTGVVKSRHGWTMYLNLVTSQYILYFKKCPIEGVE